MGVIQGSINNLLNLAVVAGRLSPTLEERRIGKQLAKQDETLEKAYKTFSEETPVPKGMNQQEAAEYDEQIATEILSEQEKVQYERAKRGEIPFENLIQTKAAKAVYSEDIYDYETDRAAKNLVNEYYQDPQEKADLAAARALIQEQNRVSRSKNMRGGNQ